MSKPFVQFKRTSEHTFLLAPWIFKDQLTVSYSAKFTIYICVYYFIAVLLKNVWRWASPWGFPPSDTPSSVVQKVIPKTSKLLGEMRADRMSPHSSARPDPHESVLAAPEGEDAPTPEGAYTPASEEVISSGSEEANHSRSADEPLHSHRCNDDVLSLFGGQWSCRR
jgi:hypothetical protein